MHILRDYSQPDQMLKVTREHYLHPNNEAKLDNPQNYNLTKKPIRELSLQGNQVTWIPEWRASVRRDEMYKVM